MSAARGMTEWTANGVDYTINDPNIAEEFDPTKAYHVRDHVYYQGNLYVFVAEHAAGAWNTSHVLLFKVGVELSNLWNANDTEATLRAAADNDLKSALSNVEHTVAGDYYKISTGASMQYSVSIPKGAKITITHNNANYNASAQLKNSNGDVLLDIGIVQSNRSETRTVWVDGVTQITGYCTGGYNATLFVESLD